ncbi:arylsulfatase [Synechococcus sp. Tobar12-5m-g]|uniref:arylsulfatase n=1 Tax=unclassified Synechococcus TaxID=2626047 RepID=UPI0020CBD162|nr:MULTISPECIES: arylsulfatase [unclassified Synechococcus]MCP9771205.1 arylsulfatase [Synechococcus sp. Tobar12-5m-g]MCP9872145.1 arylsulfatase [Synechococcus sp. Cruz CV-v-12]
MTSSDPVQRQILPIPDQPHGGLTTYDARDPDTSYPPIRDLRPPAGAPNVLVILLDDVGFGASSAFGGPCQTPNIEKLAAGGLKYNRFHTTALCSPTRQALLTGRNHHSVGMGGITEMATGAPGYNSILPNSCSPLARTLKLNGYSTAQFGKCHEVPVWQTSPMGPFDAWPTGGGGFEYFYGFIGGETNQWYPALYEGTTPVEPHKTPEQGYHLSEDLTTKAIQWIRQQKALMADKPYFTYFAPGATHAPHHVPKEWADKYKGQFDQGWDALREETFARQKQLGVIPADCQLTGRHADIPAWDTITAEMKPILARQMEVYAGFLEHTDHHIGRLIDALQELEILEDTLIYVIIGDNGASAEGSLQGCFNEMAPLTGFAHLETAEFLTERLDQLGGVEAYNHYAVGWAHAMDTPYQWTKQVASHFGGTRNGTIVHWPKGIQARGEIRSQFHHVIDVAPTILEAAGLPQPTFVNGVQQRPIEGVSMAYSFNDPKAAERRQTQYFEMMGNRGIYHKGWTAVTRHRTPWVTGQVQLAAFDDDVWELYDTSSDWTQARDLAREQPQKLHELQRLWLIEATRYNVLPLDDRFAERANPEIAGRPQLIKGTRQVVFGGMGRLSESSIVNFKNKSHAITAEVIVPEAGAEGVIVAQGGLTGGWSLYAKEGKPKYCYNFYGVNRYTIAGTAAIPAGTHQVRMEFAYDGGGLAKGGTVTLYVDGQKAGEGRVEQTEPMVFSADETCDVGFEAGSPVTDDYPTAGGMFSGEVNWVEIAVDKDAEDLDHLIRPEERLRVAMALQ